jgi:hypothetical protein
VLSKLINKSNPNPPLGLKLLSNTSGIDKTNEFCDNPNTHTTQYTDSTINHQTNTQIYSLHPPPSVHHHKQPTDKTKTNKITKVFSKKTKKVSLEMTEEREKK